MTLSWRRFLLLKLPVSILVLAILAEGTAWLLRDTPYRRHPLDQLVVALGEVKMEAAIAILGDSITQDAMGAYDLDFDGRVANLTTNQASGIPGVLLLLRRYLASNTAPKHIVIASTPEFLTYLPQKLTADTYLATVFRRPDEQAWMYDRLDSLGPPSWRPAILTFENRIFLPLVGAVMPRPKRLPGGDAAPEEDAAVEGPGGNAVAAKSVRSRADQPLRLEPRAQRLLVELCQLAAGIHAKLHVLWAPMPASVHQRWADSGDLARYRAAIETALGGDCQRMPLHDFNAPEPYPDHAFRDPDHLRRPGWSSRYATALGRYLRGID